MSSMTFRLSRPHRAGSGETVKPSPAGGFAGLDNFVLLPAKKFCGRETEIASGGGSKQKYLKQEKGKIS